MTKSPVQVVRIDCLDYNATGMFTPSSPLCPRIRRLATWCLLLLLAWGLWLWQLDASDLTFDEAATYLVTDRSPLAVVEYLRGATYEHPPVYYLLIRFWVALAGSSEFCLRVPSVAAGLLCLPLAGWVMRAAWGRQERCAEIAAALVLGAMPGMAYYAREARMYSVVMVWALISSGLFLRDWATARRWPSLTAVAELATVHLLSLATHYYLFLFILVQPAVLVIRRRWRPLVAWVAVHCALAMAALVWLSLAPGLQMTAAGIRFDIGRLIPPWSELERLLGKLLFSPVVAYQVGHLVVVLLIVVAGMVGALWVRPAAGVYLLCALLLPLGPVFALPRVPAPRYVVFWLPAMAIAVGFLTGMMRPVGAGAFRVEALLEAPRPNASQPDASLHRLPWQGASLWRQVLMCRLSLPGISLLLLSGMVFVLVSGGLREALSLERSRYGRTLATVQANARVDDALLFYGPWQEVQLRYYDPGGLPPIVKLPPQAPPLLDPAQAEPVLERLFALSTRRVWVLPASVADVDPEGFVADWLTTHTHTVWRTDDFALHLPALGAGRPFQELDLTFGSNLDLESIVFEGSVVPAGEPFRFTLYWRPSAPLEHDVRVSLSLVDEGGRVWGVRENVPGEWGARPSAWQPGERIADYEGFVLPQGAPAGRYTVRLSVRDNETGDTLLVAGRRDVELVSLWVAPPIYPPVLTDEDQSDWIAFCDPEGVECVTLVGCEPGGVRFQQGYAVPFSLNWLTPDTLSADVRVRLTLASRGPWPWRERAVLATRDVALPERSLSRLDVLASELLDEAPYSAFLPMAQVDRDLTPMQRDSVFWGQRLLTLIDAIGLPVDVPTGQASVELEVLGTDGTAWVTATGAHGVSLFDITIEGRPVQRRLPAGLEGVEVDFGEEVGLRGYRIEGDPRPGGEVRITYGWYARTRPTAIYAVFNHLMTVDGKPVAQKDGWPQDGRLLTTGWQVGEYIEDHYVLSIPTDAPPGPYRLHAGMYNAATGVRTSAHQENVRLTNDELVLEVTGNR